MRFSKARYIEIGTRADILSISRRDLAGQDQGLSFQHFSIGFFKTSHYFNELAIFVFPHTFSNVKVEEVDVENGLNDTGHHSDGVEEALSVVSVDPVEDVETTVHAQHEQVVTGDGFSLSGLGHHKQLRKYRTSLKVDRESPENLSDGEGVVENKSQNNTRSQQELHSEGIMVTVVGRLELHEYQIACPNAERDVDNLHACVVQGDETKEEIEVASAEHYSEQCLRLS